MLPRCDVCGFPVFPGEGPHSNLVCYGHIRVREIEDSGVLDGLDEDNYPDGYSSEQILICDEWRGWLDFLCTSGRSLPPVVQLELGP